MDPSPWCATSTTVRSPLPEDRNRIARELHDAVTQTLFACNLLAGALARQPDANETVRGQAQVLERLNRSALSEMRLMLFELHPDALNGVRLPELLQQAADALVGRGSLCVHTDFDDNEPIDSAQRTEIYRIAQAALSNIARHSGARQAQLQWHTRQDGTARLRITDDGCGFDQSAESTGCNGLDHMHERARKLNAQLHIRSSPGQGTDITLTLTRRENFP